MYTHIFVIVHTHTDTHTHTHAHIQSLKYKPLVDGCIAAYNP